MKIIPSDLYEKPVLIGVYTKDSDPIIKLDKNLTLIRLFFLTFQTS